MVNENRIRTTSQKIGREKSGLNGAMFCHVDFDSTGKPIGVRVSHKQKDGGSLDTVLSAIGDAITEILLEGV